jgi:hypothetical protein
MIQTTLNKIGDNEKLILSKRTKIIYTRQTSGIELIKKRWTNIIIITCDKSGMTYKKRTNTICFIDPNWIKPNSKSNGSTVKR